MKICLLGDFSPHPDEGYKNVCHALARELGAHQNLVSCLNTKRLPSPAFWSEFLGSDAQIYHLIAQPTPGSLIFSAFIRRRFAHAMMILSALKPEGFFYRGKGMALRGLLLRIANPHLVLVQSEAARRLFERNQLTSVCIPNGVDTSRFHPVGEKMKKLLRQRYCLDVDAPLALHVGHLTRKRNLLALRHLPKGGIQCLVIGSMYQRVDRELLESLKRAGVCVITGYQAHIEELYQLADVYVFPVLIGDTLSMPLSVLEAMACNLPVIATPFPGLRQYFQEGNGLFYLQEGMEIPSMIDTIRNCSHPPVTREMVSPLSWQATAASIESCYSQLLDLPCLP